MAVMGRWEIFTRNGGKSGTRDGGRGGFIMGKMRNFWSLFTWFFFFNRDSLHARLNSHHEAWSYKKRSREVLTPYFMKTSIKVHTRFFSNFVHPPLPCHLQPPPSLFFPLSCFFGWVGDHVTIDVLFYFMIIWIYTCRALVP